MNIDRVITVIAVGRPGKVSIKKEKFAATIYVFLCFGIYAGFTGLNGEEIPRGGCNARFRPFLIPTLYSITMR